VPVVEVKTPDIHGYEAVQLAFDAVPERKLSKRRSATSRRTASDRTHARRVPRLQ